LLIFGGAVGDQRAAFTIESRKHDVIHRPFSQPRAPRRARISSSSHRLSRC
jgi:hypothetical protein